MRQFKALKEWQVVNDAILEGKQSILVRKGGILDTINDFPPEEKEFLIFPTYEHQKKEYVKKEFHYLFKEPEVSKCEVGEVLLEKYKINLLCKLKECKQITDKKQLKDILQYVIYTYEFLEMRFNYRQDEPLNVLVIEPHTLEKEILVEYTDSIKGCKSWITITK